MKFTSNKKEKAYAILEEKMSEFWSELASEFPEAKASLISSFRKPVDDQAILDQVQSWYERTSATDPAQCASFLEKMIEHGGYYSRQSQKWSVPDRLGEGTLQLLVQKNQFSGVSLGGLFKCLRDNLNELNRELDQAKVWDIDTNVSISLPAHFHFTRFQVKSFKRANKGLLIILSYEGYDDY